MKKSIFALSAVASMVMLPVNASNNKQLSFYHTHTGKRIAVEYYRDGQYQADALKQVNEFLKDFRNDHRHDIDPQTLDIIYDVQNLVDNFGEIHIVSAYRSPETNEMLRNKGGGVAKSSQHLKGTAIDFRLPGTATAKLRDAAKSLKRGGVGYYEKSDFIHVDSGRVRYW